MPRLRRLLTDPVPASTLAGARPVRFVGVPDAPALRALAWAACAGTPEAPASEEEAGAWIDATLKSQRGQLLHYATWVVDRPGGSLAAAVLTTFDRSSDGNAPVIAAVLTDPTAQRQGLATGLLLRALKGLQTAKFDRVDLTIADDNPAARQLCERLGFVLAD